MTGKRIFLPLIITTFILAGCRPAAPTPQTTLSETEAKYIAEKTCIKGGESLAPGYYNENSQTWWFDANLNATKPGCSPACVVSAATKTAEINWRCTGIVLPTKAAGESIKQLFISKYPKYAKTLTITISQEAADHVRGMVSFEPNAPGGIFLAVKQNSQWQIVFEGNGIIPCSLSQHNFPSAMLSDCAD